MLEKFKLVVKILATVALAYKSITIGLGPLLGLLDGTIIYAIWRT